MRMVVTLEIDAQGLNGPTARNIINGIESLEVEGVGGLIVYIENAEVISMTLTEEELANDGTLVGR